MKPRNKLHCTLSSPESRQSTLHHHVLHVPGIWKRRRRKKERKLFFYSRVHSNFFSIHYYCYTWPVRPSLPPSVGRRTKYLASFPLPSLPRSFKRTACLPVCRLHESSRGLERIPGNSMRRKKNGRGRHAGRGKERESQRH